MNPHNHTLQSLRSILLLLALLAFAGSRAKADFVIDQVSFHKSFTDMVGGLTSEGGNADNGGVIMVFVRNTGAATESFTANQGAVNIGIRGVRFRNPINTGDFRGWEIRKWVGFEKKPVKWVFSQKV